MLINSNTRWLHYLQCLLKANNDDLREKDWRTPDTTIRWMLRVQEKGHEMYGTDFWFILYELINFSLSHQDSRTWDWGGNLLFSRTPIMDSDFVIYSGTVDQDFAMFRLGTKLAAPFANYTFLHPETSWYNIASRIGMKKYFPRHSEQIFDFFASLISQRIEEGKNVLLISKKDFRITCARGIENSLTEMGLRDTKVITDHWDKVDLKDPKIIPLINYGIVGINLFQDFYAAYCLNGYYVNEKIVNAVLQDIVTPEFNIPMQISTSGSPLRRRADLYESCQQIELLERLVPKALHQQEMDIVLQAVGRVRPYTSPREVITFQCSAHPQLEYTSEFENLEEARSYFGIVSHRNRQRDSNEEMIREAKQRGLTQRQVVSELGLGLRTVKRYWKGGNYLKKEPRNKKTSMAVTTAEEILRRHNISTRHIMDRPQAVEAVACILLTFDGILGIDIETSKMPSFSNHEKAGLDPHLSRIRLIQVYTGSDIYVFDIYATGLEPLAPIFSLPMVAHNAVFELKHLIHAGIPPPDIDCTMLMANAISGRLPSLEDLVKERFGLSISKAPQNSDWDAPVLSEEQLDYAALDAVLTLWLYTNMAGNMKTDQMQVYQLMKEAQTAVAKLELNGFCFDVVGHVELMADWTEKLERAEQDTRRLLGSEINLSSPKQIATWLDNHLDTSIKTTWPRTASGQLSTDADTLAQYSDHPLVTPLLRYRETGKLLSTYGESFSAHVNPLTGRIHANFRIGGAATGRFTCSSPNIQNPPRDKSFRSLFTAAPGKILVIADYNQIELRVAALLSKDSVLLATFEKGEDLHRKTASALTGIPMNTVTKEQRQMAKAVNFGLLYGQRAKGLRQYAKSAYGVNMTEQQAISARRSFFNSYSGLAAWQRNHGGLTYAFTPSGRYRNLTTSNGTIRYTEAINTPIQGGAAEVLLAALSILDRQLDGLDAKLVNIVHDEVVVETSPDSLVQSIEAVEKSMIQGMLAIFPNASTKNLVEVKIGGSWGEGK